MADSLRATPSSEVRLIILTAHIRSWMRPVGGRAADLPFGEARPLERPVGWRLWSNGKVAMRGGIGEPAWDYLVEREQLLARFYNLSRVAAQVKNRSK